MANPVPSASQDGISSISANAISKNNKAIAAIIKASNDRDLRREYEHVEILRSYEQLTSVNPVISAYALDVMHDLNHTPLTEDDIIKIAIVDNGDMDLINEYGIQGVNFNRDPVVFYMEKVREAASNHVQPNSNTTTLTISRVFDSIVRVTTIILNKRNPIETF